MSEVTRICPQCGDAVQLEARFCNTCGADTQDGLPMRLNSLPAKVGAAALPVVAGLAGLALRSGWKFIQRQVAEQLQQQTSRPSPAPRAQATEIEPVSPPRRQRVVRIRSSWTVADGRGNWRQGHEEHVIEIDD